MRTHKKRIENRPQYNVDDRMIKDELKQFNLLGLTNTALCQKIIDLDTANQKKVVAPNGMTSEKTGKAATDQLIRALAKHTYDQLSRIVTQLATFSEQQKSAAEVPIEKIRSYFLHLKIDTYEKIGIANLAEKELIEYLFYISGIQPEDTKLAILSYRMEDITNPAQLNQLSEKINKFVQQNKLENEIARTIRIAIETDIIRRQLQPTNEISIPAYTIILQKVRNFIKTNKLNENETIRLFKTIERIPLDKKFFTSEIQKELLRLLSFKEKQENNTPTGERKTITKTFMGKSYPETYLFFIFSESELANLENGQIVGKVASTDSNSESGFMLVWGASEKKVTAVNPRTLRR